MHSERGARGSVTAEFAVALPAVTAVLALLLVAGGAGVLQLRLEDAARAGARAAARGESPAQVTELTYRLAGERANVQVSVQGGFATVTVRGQLVGPLALLVPWRQSADAVARMESGPGSFGTQLGTIVPRP